MSYDYTTLICNYINQSATDGTTAQGRMSFKGDTLYSYESKLFQRIAPNIYILDVAISKYSITTAKHTMRILRAMPSNTVIYRTCIDNDPISNVVDYISDIKYLISKFTRARNTKFQWQEHIHKSYAELQSYIEFYKLDKRNTAYIQFKQLFAIMFEAKVL
jgi:hypothetical protein